MVSRHLQRRHLATEVFQWEEEQLELRLMSESHLW